MRNCLPFGLSCQIVLQYRYCIYLAITICKELLYLFFVCTEMHVLHKNTALITIFLRISGHNRLGCFYLLFLCVLDYVFTFLIIRILLLFVILLLLFFVGQYIAF